MPSHDHDERIHALAARQYGVVGRDQLLRAGVPTGAIDYRRRSGRLRAVHRGVYRTGPVPGRYQREMAAALACGPGAAVSDRTAAAIWGIVPPPPARAPIDVTGPRSLRGPLHGVRFHRRGPLDEDEVVQRHRLPLTSPARTILDLAGALGPYDLERVLARAVRRGIVRLEAVAPLLLRHPRRRGCAALRALIAEAAGPDLTRSEAEARFLALIRRAGMPRPRVNVVVDGMEVDFFWPDRRVVAEIDGFAFHSHRDAFENDRSRDSRLVANGLVVLRFTWRQIQREPEQVLGRLAMALGAHAPDRRRSGGA